MLSIKRKDGDAILFVVDGETVKLVCKIDNGVKLYYGRKLVIKLDYEGESNTFKVFDRPVIITYCEDRQHNSAALGFDADRSVKIYRDDFQGAQS